MLLNLNYHHQVPHNEPVELFYIEVLSTHGYCLICAICEIKHSLHGLDASKALILTLPRGLFQI